MNEKDLIELKDDHFTYCDKKFTQKRWVTKDLKLLITSDNGFDYCLVYRAGEKGQGVLVEDEGFYHENNRHSYPIYHISEALERIKKFNITSEFKLIIHKSQYKYQNEYNETN